eukprot:364668-Chlamydomonas_euryale.AAC.7
MCAAHTGMCDVCCSHWHVRCVLLTCVMYAVHVRCAHARDRDDVMGFVPGQEGVLRHERRDAESPGPSQEAAGGCGTSGVAWNVRCVDASMSGGECFPLRLHECEEKGPVVVAFGVEAAGVQPPLEGAAVEKLRSLLVRPVSVRTGGGLERRSTTEQEPFDAT